MKTLVVGIGSTILCDDGVGVRVVERLRARSLPTGVDTLELGTAGLGMLDLAHGYDRLIVVDAMVSGAAPGTLHTLRGEEVAESAHLGAGHEADLATTLALGRKLPGFDMPVEVVVIAVEAKDLTTFSEELTPEVAAAVNDAAAAVLTLLSG